MNRNCRRAFTLIELLTVIAIIAILAGLLAVAVPRALEKAKIADVEGDFNNIRTALAQYYTDNGSYPPGYGYMLFKSFNKSPMPTPGEQFQLRPYMDMLGFYGVIELYDRYGISHDLNRDDEIEWLEYSPLRDANQLFPGGLYPFTSGTPGPPELLKGPKALRPYVYIPVYLEHFRTLQNRLKKGATWAAAVAGLDVAPPRYDAYALVGVGPGGNDGGVVTIPVNDRPAWATILNNLPKDSNTTGQNRYYVLGLRAYWFATLDANDNGLLDYDFRARTRNGERGILPDGTGGFGPMIYVGK